MPISRQASPLPTAALRISPALAAALAQAQAALGDAEEGARAAEAAHSHARDEIDAARTPLAAAERRVQRLETEAKTISKLLAVESSKSLAAGDGRAQRPGGLRKGARRRTRRRFGRAGRSVSTDALGGRGDRSGRPDFARRRATAFRLCAGAGRAGAAACADRRCRARRRARPGGLAQAGSAARHARRRLLALGRLCRRGACADRRGAAARRARPAGCDRDRTDDGAHRNGE